MAVSFNSVPRFNSTLKEKPQNISRRCLGAYGLKTNCIAVSSGPWFAPKKSIKNSSLRLFRLAAESNQIATDPTNKDSGNAELSAAKAPSIKSPTETSAKDELGAQMPEATNGVGIASDKKTSTSSTSRPLKRSSLTAREKLRAARVLSRYTDSKPAKKAEYGSSVLDALRESDRGKKRSGLPEAPTNMLDDSKRGMPKQGLTFDFPGGIDLFFIVLSFVLISATMFATTFIVWKLGAIHFNEN